MEMEKNIINLKIVKLIDVTMLIIIITYAIIRVNWNMKEKI